MQSKSKSQVLESHQIDISVWYCVLLYLNLYALLSLLKWYLSASQLFIKGDNWCDYFFLPLSLLLVQQSILVGLVFFRVHRAIYLLWRIQGENLYLALRAESCDAEQLQPLWEPIPGARAGPSVLSPAPACESEDLVCQRRVSHPWSHIWTRGPTPWPWHVTSTATLSQQCWMPMRFLPHRAGTWQRCLCAIRSGLADFQGHCAEPFLSWIWVSIVRFAHTLIC